MTTVDRRRFLRGAAGVAGVGLLGACTKSSRATSAGSRPTVRTSGGDFGFPSPFTYQRGPGYWRMIYLYDTLLWKDASGSLLPWLAKDWQRSADGKTYTFQLRQGVRWSDGSPLTAEDVAFTFTYLQTRKVSPQVFVRAQGVASATATAADTVEIRLTGPLVTFLNSVAGALPIVPKHIWSSIAEPSKVTDPKVLVGSGPYRLASYTRGEGSYLYTANDGFFLGRPYVQRIEMRPVGDELTALQAGQIDIASLTVARQNALVPFQRAPYRILRGSEDFTLALYWNLGKGGALADARFRQACCLAIDRKAAVQKLLTGNGDPGNPGFLPPTHPFFTRVEQYSYDPARAAALLDSAGYRKVASGLRQGQDGRPLRFTMVVNNSPVPPVADIVVQQLLDLGVQVQVQALDTPTLDSRTTSGSYELAITNFGGLGGDPDYMRQIYSSKVPKRFQSVQGYVNPQFDQISAQQLTTLDTTQRRLLIDQMQQIVARDVPMIPLYYPRLYAVFRTDRFDSWYFTPGGFAGGVPTVFNKQVFVTGRKTGLSIRPTP